MEHLQCNATHRAAHMNYMADNSTKNAARLAQLSVEIISPEAQSNPRFPKLSPIQYFASSNTKLGNPDRVPVIQYLRQSQKTNRIATSNHEYVHMRVCLLHTLKPHSSSLLHSLSLLLILSSDTLSHMLRSLARSAAKQHTAAKHIPASCDFINNTSLD